MTYSAFYTTVRQRAVERTQVDYDLLVIQDFVAKVVRKIGNLI